MARLTSLELKHTGILPFRIRVLWLMQPQLAACTRELAALVYIFAPSLRCQRLPRRIEGTAAISFLGVDRVTAGFADMSEASAIEYCKLPLGTGPVCAGSDVSPSML